MRKIALLVSCCLLVFKTQAEPELKGSAAELTEFLAGMPKTVAITADSEIKMAADRAIVTLKVVTENKSLQEALRANQSVRSKILNSLKESGIPADRIQAARFSSTPKYGLFSEKAKSYRVENFVKIITQDEKEFQAAANLVDSLPEVRYDGIEFEHSNKDSLKPKAIALALDKAAEKKKMFEEKLGVRLSPKGFAEGPTVMRKPLTQAEYTLSYASGKSRVTSIPNVVADEPAGEVLSGFGELVYTAQVTVEYAVESK